MIYDLPVESSAQPPGWSTASIKELADLVGGGTPDTGTADYWDPPVIPWVTPTDISNCPHPVLTKTDRGISDAGLKACSATLLPARTTLLTSRATVGECRIAGMPVATNQGFASLVAKNGVDSNFLFYLTQTLKPVLVRLASGTTFVEVSRREVRRVRTCIPSDDRERRNIGEILVAADDAITSAEAKLTTAKRLKTALMQQLFTRGIPGRHVRFKQTKIGEIPADWDVMSISNILSENIYNGVSPQSRPEPPGRPILNVSCISSGRCNPKKVTFVDLADPPADVLAEKGDFFVLRGNGNRDFIATGGVLNETPPEGCLFSDLLIKIPFDPTKIVNGFIPLLWQAGSFLRRLQAKAVSGSGLWKIGLREIRRHQFAKPSPEEQQAIVNILRSADDSIDTCESEVRALHRLKRSLLQNLLTGKVRVKLPETP